MNKNFASASPAENMVLAFFLMVLFIILAGYTEPATALVLIPLGFSASIVQTIAGVVQLKNNDIMGGNINLAFSVFTWQACIETLLKALQIIPANTAFIDGWLYLMMGLLLLGFTPTMFKANSAAALFIAGADIFFMGTTYASLFGSATVGFYAAWGLILCVVSCLWQGVGISLNDVYGRTVVDFGPAIIKSNTNEAA
ncbi:MAG: hypothetical protein ABFC94_13355 [Syntrophomonas sp.]